jgi:hypothetical protein
VERELRAQVDRARAAGIRLSHLDSHMGTLFGSPALLEVYRAGRGLRAAACSRTPRPRKTPSPARRGTDALWTASCRSEPGVTAAGWLGAYEKMLAPLPPGVYELIVHLAYDDDEMKAPRRTIRTGGRPGGSPISISSARMVPRLPAAARLRAGEVERPRAGAGSSLSKGC